MKRINVIAMLTIFALSCTNSAKKTEDADVAAGGGTSEETNALVYNEVSPATGRDGSSQTALAFNTPNSYASSIKYGGKFSVATAFEISAWFRIDSLPQKSDKPYNLIGKNDAFSLAIANGVCGTKAPTFIFYLTEETSAFACEQAVLSKNSVKAGLWTHIEAKWDGRYLTLYQDGHEVAKEERILAVLPYSNLPVYFGKSGVPFSIDGLSLNTEAL